MIGLEEVFSRNQIKLLATFNLKYQLSFNISEMIKSVGKHFRLMLFKFNLSPANSKQIQQIPISLSSEVVNASSG